MQHYNSRFFFSSATPPTLSIFHFRSYITHDQVNTPLLYFTSPNYFQNQQFHNLTTELSSWLSRTEDQIKSSEPVDLSADEDVLEKKFHHFRELRKELERCEPRVVGLNEAAKTLYKNRECSDKCKDLLNGTSQLRLKLQSSIKLTGIYILKLGAVLGKDPNEMSSSLSSSPSSSSPLHQSTSYDVSLPKRCIIL